jgi:hypothetical protein
MTRARELLDRAGQFGQRPPVLHGLLLAGLIFAAYVSVVAASGDRAVAYDAHVYWKAASLNDPYRETIRGGFDGVGGLYEYKYPPPLAQILAPLHLLPWPIFLFAWTLVLYLAFLRLAGRWAYLVLLLFPLVLGELFLGNINLLIGLAIVAGFRWPAAWAFIVLTKITTGVGVLWFAFRGEWRAFWMAIAVTAGVAIVSFAIAPGLWADFLQASTTQTGATLAVPTQAAPIPLPVRLVPAVILVAYAARTNRAWLVPVAVAISTPFLWWNVLTILLACIPLASAARADRSALAPASRTVVVGRDPSPRPAPPSG